MARKTFGRAGQLIDIPTDGNGEDVRIREVELPGESGSVTESTVGIEDASGSNLGTDFEPVGDVIRTEPITDTDAGTAYTDPANATGKRPRKPRGPNRPKDGASTAQGSTRVISAQLDALLFGLHTMAATLLHEPEFAINADESKVLAEAIEKMANAYNLSAVLSPKTAATVDLCIAVGIVYGPRVMKLMNKPRSMRNVTNIDKAGTQS